MVWPTERERNWHNAMGVWWYTIEAVKEFEDKHRNCLLTPAQAAKLHQLRVDCANAEAIVERYKAK